MTSRMTMHRLVLLSMETSETLMDECIKRADRIIELETGLERMQSGERAADGEIERLNTKISYTKTQYNDLNKAYERREHDMLTELNEVYAENVKLVSECCKIATELNNILRKDNVALRYMLQSGE